ncbi:peptidoglycan DD-metalloendopeptidase family protein [Streptomyces sp. NPDC048057]|uniref:M23 family metallopeptidase n=1 Tax=Streptomyces sp. NPDC048057 TaxID=3155628 RepID=UPI0033C34235
MSRRCRSPLLALVVVPYVLLTPAGAAGASGVSEAVDESPPPSAAAPPPSPSPVPSAGPVRQAALVPAAATAPEAAPKPPAPSPPSARKPSHGPAADTTAETARLFEEAAKVTAAYEKSLRQAEERRREAIRLQGEIERQRKEVAAIHDAVGAVAREQYRTGGQLTATAQLLLSRDPDELMRLRRLARQAENAVRQLLGSARQAERQLVAAEDRARRAWHDLDERKEKLAKVKAGLETKLEKARWTLQGEADDRVAAGSCPGAVRSTEPAPDPVGAGAGWVAPVAEYVLSAGFGSGGARWANRHTGQDFAVDIGTPVRSAGAGRVRSVSCGGAFGIEIVVEHPGGYYTQYAHLSSVAVDQRDPVAAGQLIGLAGSTGNSTGPHLHFEVRLTPYLGSGVDPAAWLRERGVRLGSAGD